MDFQYYMPTRVICGRDCLKNGGGDLLSLGKKAFVMTGPSSASRNGSLDDLFIAFKSVGIESKHYNEVEPNPTIEKVREAAEQAAAFGADFVVAIGGGSPIDAAKAVCVLAGSTLTDEELLSTRSFPDALPLAAVPTTAGTGSEVTQYSILTNNKLKTKSFLVSHDIFPRISFLDGKYMETLPGSITAATAVDAISHAMEGFLAVRATPVARAIALESLSVISAPFSKIALGEPLSLTDRDDLLFASMLAGIVIAQSGTTAVHVMGYSLTYFKGIDHGKANGLLMAAYFEYLSGERKEEVDKLLTALGMDGVAHFDSVMKKLLGSETLTEEEIDRFAAIALKAGNIANTRPQPGLDDLKSMLTASLA